MSHMRHNMHPTMRPTTEPIPVVTDPFELVNALCDDDEWELALRIARAEDVKALASRSSRSSRSS
jgi:hypothetical protein